MKKISQKDAKRIEARGGKVRRKMGTAKPKPAPKPEPKPEPPKQEVKPHASMAASVADTAAREQAALMVQERNNQVIEQFTEVVKNMPKPAEPSPYTFDLKRDKDGLLKRVYARPGILEKEDEIQRH